MPSEATCQLWRACVSGDVAAARAALGARRALLWSDCSVNAHDAHDAQRTALHKAVHAGHTPLLPVLLDAGAAVNAADSAGATAVHAAAASADAAAALRILLPAGADVRALTCAKQSALHLAAEQRHAADAVRLLLEAGADVNAVNARGNTPLHIAAFNNADTDTVAALIAAGANVNAASKDGRTPLHRAAGKDAAPLVRMLLHAGSRLDAVDATGCSALHIAALCNKADTVLALLASGADAAALTKSGRTPLHQVAACASSDVRAVVRALVAHNRACLSAADEDGATPLHIAALYGSAASVAALLEAGASCALADGRGWTPLHAAAGSARKGSNAEGVAALLAAGASPFARAKDGATPVELARLRSGADHVVRMLLQAAADAAAPSAPPAATPPPAHATLRPEGAGVVPEGAGVVPGEASDPRSAGCAEAGGSGASSPSTGRTAPPAPYLTCELKYKDITFDRDEEDDEQVELGRGGFGTVYAGSWCGEAVAIKKVRLSTQLIHSGRFWSEVQLHMSASHKHVVHVYGAAVRAVRSLEDVMDCYIVMDRLVADLGALLHKRFTPGHPAAHLQAQLRVRHGQLRLLLGIARGLRFLHARGIVHADLKPGNVMLDEHGAPQLTDFGLAVQRSTHAAHSEASHKGERGTRAYMDPALSRGHASVTPASDVYSWGVLAWEVLTLRTPLDARAASGHDGHDAYSPCSPCSPCSGGEGGAPRVDACAGDDGADAARGGAPASHHAAMLDDIADAPPALRALIARCWSAEQAARPSASDMIAVLAPLAAAAAAAADAHSS